MPDIYSRLDKLAESDMYPFHMPGHKRNLKSTPFEGAFRCDITEIDGFDNLHDRQGIIFLAEKRANELYGADETFFLVNGSTAGILAGVSAAVSDGGRVLAARGSHKSFYHTAYLRHLQVDYIPVKIIDRYGIFDGYSKEDIKKALDATDNNPEAVFITSPTYEGKCSDIEGIANLCHERNIPLIVDAAHGAHLGFGEGVPKGAVSQGADVVIHSVHKTLPSMTQTALLHVQGNLVDRDKLKRFLRIYQSSSPSYVLMASIDMCMKEMEEKRKQFIEKLVKYRNLISDGAKSLEFIRIPGLDELEDPAKVLIFADSDKMTGQRLYDILREDYCLQLEMAGVNYALAMLSGCDTDEGVSRLITALGDIDKTLLGSNHITASRINSTIPGTVMSIDKAWDAEREIVDLKKAAGRIAGEFINLYPPGIPIIAPGEVFDEKLIEEIKRLMALNLNIQGIFDGENKENKGIIETGRRGVLCVKQK